MLPDVITLHCELRRKGVTLQLLWKEYTAAHPDQPTYRYTQFVEHYRCYARTLKRSMRQLHRAGEKLFIDYAGPTLPVIDAATGEISQAHIFVADLGASNYTYACATPGETQVDWLTALSQAFSDTHHVNQYNQSQLKLLRQGFAGQKTLEIQSSNLPFQARPH